MKLFNDITAFDLPGRPVVTLGNFDGVHLGHLEIFRAMKRIAEEQASAEACSSVVLTFRVHPRKILFPEIELPFLLTLEERLDALAQTGIDAVVLLDFTKEIAQMHAGEFIRSLLVDRLNVSHVVIGYDHAFGKNREGNIDSLLAIGAHYGFGVTQVPPFVSGDNPVSSSRIRDLLNEGDVSHAAQFLGRPYSFTGIISHGFARGREIGFQTANIVPDNPDKLIPCDGVYATHVSFADGRVCNAITNIGKNPTFEGVARTVETHILDFNADIYGQTLTITFVECIRGEMKFGSVDELVAQIKLDVERAKEILMS
jgi:riboflavin kinase / FMN adenylyltransferase